nr:Ig-like domain-containing protein [uncultured Albidiferax sp.]
MRHLKFWMIWVLTASLVACGGGGNPGSTSNNSTPNVSSIGLLASASALDSSSTSAGVIITAVVKNASNNGVASQAVSFSANSGLLQSASTATDANGKATVTLSTGGDSANRSITVTATAGGVSNTITIPVTGTSVGVTGSASMLIGASTTFAVKVTDSGGAVVPNASVSVVSALSNPVNLLSSTTNTAGAASFSYTATNTGNDILTVTSSGASTQYAVAISNTNFSFISPSDGADVAIGSTQVVTVQLLPAAAGTTINFSSTRGVVATPSVVTNASGLASTTVSSTTAGSANITAQILNGAQTRRSVNFVATTPASVVLQANVSAIAPNSAGSSANVVTLTATVRDASGNAVKNQVVNFSIVSDTSGGSIGTGSGTTNGNGVITDTFIPGPSSTAANGVVLQAMLASNSSISNTMALTVSARALFITIGTSNTITNLDQNTYSKPFSVYVNDANGVAVTNQTIVLSVYPLSYIKGSLTFTSGAWVHSSTDTVCVNEDANRDGIVQATEDDARNVAVSSISVTGAGNGDGVLTPGLPGFLSPSSVTTDSTGLATFNLNYGEQYAPWLYFEVKARASVSGTESSAVYYYSAAGLASDFTSATVAPSGVTSPFGTATNCSDPR